MEDNSNNEPESDQNFTIEPFSNVRKSNEDGMASK